MNTLRWLRWIAAMVIAIPAFIIACTGVGVPFAIVLMVIAWVLMPRSLT